MVDIFITAGNSREAADLKRRLGIQAKYLNGPEGLRGRRGGTLLVCGTVYARGNYRKIIQEALVADMFILEVDDNLSMKMLLTEKSANIFKRGLK